MTECCVKKSIKITKPGTLLWVVFALLAAFLFAGCSGSIRVSSQDRVTYRESKEQYKSSNWETRLLAVRKMSSVTHASRDEFLLGALEDTHPLVRIEALKGLMKTVLPRARRTVKHLAEYEKNDNVRWYALRTLSSFGEATAAPVFVKGLDSSDSILREESISGLLAIEDFTVKYVSVPYIIQALKDQSINVRVAALRGLHIKDRRIYAVLAGMLDEKQNRQYTILAPLLRALSGYRLDPAVRQKLSSLLTHPNAQIRILSLRTLKKDLELEKSRQEM